jgi:4-hydroxy-tetrahydrodipicolinate synthase
MSVLSNLLPAETSKMCHLCLEGNYPAAAKMQLDYLPLINALFCEVNPIPVQTVCAMMGLDGGELRLPLCEMEEEHREQLEREMRAVGLI